MTRQSQKNRSLYSVHPGVAKVAGWIEGMRERSGRSLEEWLDLIEREGPATEEERRDWLKQAHGQGTNTAGWLAARSLGLGMEDSDPDAYLLAAERYVEAMYAGKESLRPLYDRLLEIGLGLGPEATASPGKTIVPIYRKHVVAQIKPTTRTRIDLGLALGKYQGLIPPRLIDTGGLAKGDRITHRIPIASMDDIDDEVETWMRKAWDADY